MLDKRIQNFGECVRVEGIARPITSNTHWDLVPWHNSFRCEVEFSTRVQPQQLANKNKFCGGRLRFAVGVLSTHLLKSTSTARWVARAHGRTLTINAEGQHPSNTNVGKCRSVRRQIFPQFPVLFVLPNTCKIFFLVIYNFRKGCGMSK